MQGCSRGSSHFFGRTRLMQWQELVKTRSATAAAAELEQQRSSERKKMTVPKTEASGPLDNNFYLLVSRAVSVILSL